MNADLLRRAAAKLRAGVTELNADWRERPWRPVLVDGESLTGVAACKSVHALNPEQACDYCWHMETYSEAVAAYIALAAHPPVALALADLLDARAGTVGGDRGDLEAVARAILREPGDGETR